MFLFRIIGYLLLLAGLVALGAELLVSLEAGSWSPISLGQRWFEFFGPASIQSVQVGLERYVHPIAWDPVQRILEAPAWLPLVVLGLFLILIARRRRRRRVFGD